MNEKYRYVHNKINFTSLSSITILHAMQKYYIYLQYSSAFNIQDNKNMYSIINWKATRVSRERFSHCKKYYDIFGLIYYLNDYVNIFNVF